MKYPTVYIQFPNGKIYPFKANNLLKIDKAQKQGGVLVEKEEVQTTPSKRIKGSFNSAEKIRNSKNYFNRGY